MKKFALTALATATLLGAGSANAFTHGTLTNGFIVPNVVHDGSNLTTAVGIINKSTRTIPLYWTFFDQESNHVTDGCFLMTQNDYQGFNWAVESGTGMENKRGYLVFAVGDPVIAPGATSCPAAANLAAPGPGAQVSANAFFVDVASADVAFTPVVDGDLGLLGDLTTLGPDSLVWANGAFSRPAGHPDIMNMRYFVDGAPGGNDTAIVVWSTGDQRGTHTVNMYDDKQNRKSVNFALEHSELDWFNPETIPGRPADFLDGFIEWAPFAVTPGDFPGAPGTSLAAMGGSVYSYSVVSAPAFGAVQTLLASHPQP